MYINIDTYLILATLIFFNSICVNDKSLELSYFFKYDKELELIFKSISESAFYFFWSIVFYL